MKRIRIVTISVLIIALMTFTSLAESDSAGQENAVSGNISALNNEQEQIVRRELGIEGVQLSEEAYLALLTKGSATVWNSTYSNQYNVKKSFSMTASLLQNNGRPYTRFTVTNTGNSSITVIAYKGSIGGSTTINSMTVAPGKAKSMTITRADVINYGTINGQGTSSVLSYTVSLHNYNNAFSCKVKAIRYY